MVPLSTLKLHVRLVVGVFFIYIMQSLVKVVGHKYFIVMICVLQVYVLQAYLLVP